MATRAGVDQELCFLVDPRPRNVVISSLSLRSERGGSSRPQTDNYTFLFGNRRRLLAATAAMPTIATAEPTPITNQTHKGSPFFCVDGAKLVSLAEELGDTLGEVAESPFSDVIEMPSFM